MWVIYGEKMAPGRGNKPLYIRLKTIFNIRWWMSKTNNSWVDSETMHYMWGHIFLGDTLIWKTIIYTKVDDAPFWGCHPCLCVLFDKTLQIQTKNNPNLSDIDNPWLNYSTLCQTCLPTSLTGEPDHVSSCKNPLKLSNVSEISSLSSDNVTISTTSEEGSRRFPLDYDQFMLEFADHFFL